tara:strand:+ start:396 stop:650 length:255 start_codon:yes stop_codon:yes gene_type:complete
MQPTPGGFLLSLEEARMKADIALEFLVQIQDNIGMLDDLFESQLIDNRGPWTDLGAYQYIGRAINRLEEYIWEIKEAESNGESE